MTSDRTNQGLASMPAQERSLPVDGRGQKADQPAPAIEMAETEDQRVNRCRVDLNSSRSLT